MALLSGSASVTRFSVTSRPEEPDFEPFAFREIPSGSEIRERIGFVPYEPEAPYRVGQHRFFFRVRIDVRRPDSTAVKERVKELVRAEREATGAAFVGSKKRRLLREQAEEELLARAAPRTTVIECCLDENVLWVGTTANTNLGTVLALAAAVGITAEYKAPWIDRAEEEVPSAIVEFDGPGQSVLGCRFLRTLVDDDEIMVEPEAGSVTLVTPETRVTLQGSVTEDLHRYLKRECEILSARLLYEDTAFRFDGPSFRIGSMRVETEKFDSWIELLDARLEQIAGVYDALDAKYAALSDRLHRLPAAGETL